MSGRRVDRAGQQVRYWLTDQGEAAVANEPKPEVSTALQMKAKGDRLYLWCPTCDRTARSWLVGAPVTVPQLILAEQQHKAAAHPQHLDLTALHDAVYDDPDENQAG